MTDFATLLQTRRWVYWIPDEATAPDGFVPHVVFEDWPETYPIVEHQEALSGQPTFSYWGPTRSDALARARSANSARGIEPMLAIEIVSSAIMAAAMNKKEPA